MKSKLLVLILMCGALMKSSLLAATVPVGTTLVVQTAGAISSHATPGRTFTARLEQDVVINGNVLLRAGTYHSGASETYRCSPSTPSSKPRTLNPTAVSAGGR